MTKITYLDKTNSQTSALPDINKVSDDDMNHIKNVINLNDDALVVVDTKVDDLTLLSGAVPIMYNFDAITVEAAPSTGYFRFNTATPVSATEIYISASDDHFNLEIMWDSMLVGSFIYVKSRADQTLGGVYEITSIVKNGTTWYKFGVTALDGSGAMPDGDVCALFLLATLPAASGEANTYSSVGTGLAITKTKVGVDLPFKSLLGDGINVSGAGNEVTFEVKEELFSGTRLTNAAVTTTQALDWDVYKVFEFTLTGNTTISDSNLPTGTETKVIEMIITGNFTLTFPAYYEALPSNDTYDGTKRNHLVISCVVGTAASEDIVYSLQTLTT